MAAASDDQFVVYGGIDGKESEGYFFNAGSGSIAAIYECDGNANLVPSCGFSILKIEAEKGELDFVILKDSKRLTS